MGETETTEMDDERTVDRETVLDASPSEVWEAISEESRLEEWLADEVELELVEGGDASFRFADGERRGTIDAIEEERRLAFTWSRPGEPPSHVEFRIEAIPEGTRLLVTESALVAARSAFRGPVAYGLGGAAWERRLSTLAGIVRLVLVA
jgi:uncharacterized protein YndB with AHSA1/START domain